jgi:chromate reductase
MTKFKVGLIVGSNRAESLNRRLALALSKAGASKLDFTWLRIDDLPMYNQDLDSELPASVVRFKTQIGAADGVLFVTPEHNRSLPALVKNAIDWGARPYGKNSWAGKPALITGTSPGAIATAVAQQHLRQILGTLGVLVMGGEAYITFKPDLIDAQGNVSDESTAAFLQALVNEFAALLARLSPAAERGIMAA